MKNRSRHLRGAAAGIALLAALAAAGAAPAPQPADLILTNAAVYTVDASRSWADAVAVRGGRVAYVGTAAGAKKLQGPSTRVVDLAGKMVLPGFHDAHVHPVSGGMELALCNLNGIETREKIFQAIREYAAAHPGESWIVGGGWDLPIFPDAGPTRQELDALVPDRPALISSADGHSSWANTKALELAGITKATPDPPAGRIERDAEGNPSGTLRESADEAVQKKVPKPTAREYREGLERGVAMANRFGITSFVEANAGDEILAAYGDAEKRGALSARVVVSLAVDESGGPGQVAELARKRAAFTRGRLRATAAKIFADGVIESGTASMLEPYLGSPGGLGKPNLTPEAFRELATALDREGFQIHIHAIGDRGVRDSLDALEAARKANGPRDARPLLAHIELIEPEDIPRFRRLGVVADFQPLWAWADPYIKDLTLPKLGPERSRWIYPIGSVAATGAVVAGGSDWSVSSMNPLDGIQVAITRRGLTEEPGPAFLPEERIALPEALAAYTIAGAWAMHQERETGSIEVGKKADLVVLDRNVFEIPPEKIHEAKVLLTLLDGREVWREPSFR